VARPRKKKYKKRSWWARKKWAVLGGVVLGLVAAGLLASAHKSAEKVAENASEKEKTADPNDGAKSGGLPGPWKQKVEKWEKPNPWKAPTVIAPPKAAPKVLLVLPSKGVWFDDYTDVRAHLEKKGATVVTASTEGGSSRPFADPRNHGDPVPVDKLFNSELNLSEYAALVFLGHLADEYVFGRGSATARQALQKMQQAGKPVAAIAFGQGVLLAHGVLKGKHAADCQPLRQLFPAVTEGRGILWDGPGVTVDGKIITASGGREAVQFAEAILKAIEK
jgi:putative intracellular protease/amidase